MTLKCFWCDRKRWTKKYAPYCSKKCKQEFAKSPQRKKRLKWCKKQLELEQKREMVRASEDKLNENSQNNKLSDKQASFDTKKDTTKQLNAEKGGSRL